MIARRLTSLSWIVLGFTVSLIALAASDSLESNLEQLRRYPPAYRQVLAANLEKFQALPADRQAALRELDRRLTEADPQIRERYFRVLRHYSSWSRGLDDVARRQLDSAPPEELMAVIRRLRGEPHAHATQQLDDRLALVARIDALSLNDRAYLVRCWFSLTEPQRAELQSAPSDERLKLLERFGTVNETSREGLDDPGVHATADAALVSQANLERFWTNLPTWLLTGIDPLPEHAARKHLIILYRLSFPAPREISEREITSTPLRAEPPETAPAASSSPPQVAPF